MATDTKQKPPASPNAAPKSEIDKKFVEITANLDPEKKSIQDEDREYVITQLSQTAGARVRKLALTIKAGSKLREDVEKLAHELEKSVPVLARKARTEDALVTQIEALVNQTEKSIVSMAKEEEAHEKKEHEKHEKKDHKIHPHEPEKPEKADKSAGKTFEEKAKAKVEALQAEIRGETQSVPEIVASSTLAATLTANIPKLEAEEAAYAAGTVNAPLTPEQKGAIRLEELRKEMQGETATKPPVTGPQKERSGANKILTHEEIQNNIHEAGAKEKVASRVQELRGDTAAVAKNRERFVTAKKGGPAQRPKLVLQTPGTIRKNPQPIRGMQTRIKANTTLTPADYGETIVPNTRKMGSIGRRLGSVVITRNEYSNTALDSEITDTEYSSRTPGRGGKVAHGPSDNNQSSSQGDGSSHGPNRSPGKTRGRGESAKALRGGLGAGNGGGAGNIIRGGLGGGVKSGANLAIEAAKKSIWRNPIVYIIAAGVIFVLFLVWIIAGDSTERARQAQNCAVPTETMKVTVTGPTDATAGQTLPYQINVTDTVPNQEVTVVATIPEGISTAPADVTSSWTRYTLTGNTITWKATENLPPNSLNPPNFPLTVTLKATAPSTNAVLIVNATPNRTAAVAPAPPGAPGQTAGRQKSTEELMAIYGSTESEVRAQLVTIDFQGKRVQVHAKVKAAFEKVNAEITAANTGYNFRSVGTFNWRTKNCPGGCSGLSTHSFGITMDINPDTNPYTRANTHDIPQVVADIFKRNGFIWGGDWQPTHDWMHFEYAGEPGAVAPGAPAAPGGGTNCPPGGAAGGPVSADYIPPSADNCGGKYTANMSKNPTRQNFGDPQCNFNKDALHNLLVQEDPQDADFWFIVIECESGYNPNAWASPQTGTPDPGGAWGLYQMGSSSPPGQPPTAPGRGGPTDRGDVPWVIQTKNAVSKSNQLGGDEAGMRRYWSCAR